ncbi:reverse transcriptase domain-containing protein [Tanacetum coccineum]
MRTRSQARISVPEPPVRQPSVESSNLEKPDNPPIVTMDDNRTMAQLLEAPTEGYEDAIVVPEITANNFEIKHGLLNLVQNKQFFGHDKEDPHAHIRYFNKITSTMKFPNVPSTSVKLMLFPFSLEGAARIWLEKEPPRSILTWDDLVSKFINKFFPPSKTTNLRNEITRFQQKFDETFYEAWDRFNDLLRDARIMALRLSLLLRKHFFMEEIDEFLERDDSIPPGVDGIYDSEGDTVYIEELLSVINSDPNLPPSPVCEINVPEKVKSSCEDPPDLELQRHKPPILESLLRPLRSRERLPSPAFTGLCPIVACLWVMQLPPGHVPKGMFAIFHDIIDKPWKSSWMIFSVFGILSLLAFPLVKMHQGLEDTNLVDKAKVDVIAKCLIATTSEGYSVSFHSPFTVTVKPDFYLTINSGFSKIAYRPMTHLLEKGNSVYLSKSELKHLKTLKMKLTQAPFKLAPRLGLCPLKTCVIQVILLLGIPRANDFPDCEDSHARSIHKSFTSSASFWESSIQI